MTSEFLNDVLLPIVVFLLMLVTGTGMNTHELRALAGARRTALLCIAAQLALVPALALAMIKAAGPAPFIALGLMILAISPSGALSTVYVYIGRGNAALSALLTAAGTIVYALAFPLLAVAVEALLGQRDLGLSLPVGRMFGQLLGFMVLPVLLGVAIRIRFPGPLDRFRWALDFAAAALLAVVVAVSAMIGWRTFLDSFVEITALAAGFSVTALGLGLAVARFVDRDDRSAFAVECAVRNIPIAILMVSGSFESRTMIGFFVGFFLANSAILASYSVVQRYRACQVAG